MKILNPIDPNTPKATGPQPRVDPKVLYFAAKTTDERYEDMIAMEQEQAKRRPKYIDIKFASWSSLIFFAILWLSLNTESILLGGGGLPGVSFWFLAGLILLYTSIACARYISDACYRYGAPLNHFLISYCAIFSILYGGSIGGIFNAIPQQYFILVVTAIHWAAIALVCRVIISRY